MNLKHWFQWLKMTLKMYQKVEFKFENNLKLPSATNNLTSKKYFPCIEYIEFGLFYKYAVLCSKAVPRK